MTTVPETGETVGPLIMPVVALHAPWVIPVAPDSEAPMESVSIRFGKRSRNSSFTEGEKTAAVEESENSDDRS